MLYVSLAVLLLLLYIAVFGLGRLTARSARVGQLLYAILIAAFVGTLVAGLYGNQITLLAGQ